MPRSHLIWIITCFIVISNKSAFAEDQKKINVSLDTCSKLAQSLIDAQIISTHLAAVNELLDFSAYACGLKTANSASISDKPRLQIPDPILVHFTHANLKILWDGKGINLNEKADLTMQHVMPPSFSNIIEIQESDITAELPAPQSLPNECKGFINCLMTKLTQQSEHLQNIYKNGETHLIISGYAWHDRSPYSKAQQSRLNEQTWGFGLERVYINEQGNRDSVSVLIFKDSMSHPQFNLSYEIQKRLFKQGSVTAYAGVTMGVLSRKQFDYKPLPFVFPSATLNIGKVNLKTVVVPKIGRSINPGTVVFLFGSISL